MRSRSKSNKHKLILLFGIILLLGFVFYKFYIYPKIIFDTLVNKNIGIINEREDLNILLLGIGGGNHEGPNLTDTIILANINPKKNTIKLISIPRDTWVPELKAKINTAYAFGEGKKEGGGLVLAKSVVSRITGQTVDYALRIDFDGFIKAIDMLGGVEVNVENTLDDYEYPITGKENDLCGLPETELEKLSTASSQHEVLPCRYEHLHFDKGLQTMDGESALKFVRSRTAEGKEGSDFARSKRQEKVIEAFKEKFFSVYTIINPVKIIGIIDILKASIDTDIKNEQYDDFIKIAQKLREAKVVSVSLDTGDENINKKGLLINPPIESQYGYQWVIIPAAGVSNYDEIHSFIECFIDESACIELSISPTIPQ